MKNIKVFGVEQKVLIGEKFDIKGVITAISIRYNDRVVYEIGYWDKSTYHEKWLEPYQLKVETKKSLKIGFNMNK